MKSSNTERLAHRDEVIMVQLSQARDLEAVELAGFSKPLPASSRGVNKRTKPHRRTFVEQFIVALCIFGQDRRHRFINITSEQGV